jgi:hypothetical protein
MGNSDRWFQNLAVEGSTEVATGGERAHVADSASTSRVCVSNRGSATV